MKKYSHILWILISLSLVSCSGRRSAGTLEMKDALLAETQFEIQYVASGEKYKFSPTKNWGASFNPEIFKQEVTVTLSNQSNVAVTYPDPDWTRTEENYVEPWIKLAPERTDELYKGALGKFSIRLITELNGPHASAIMRVKFDQPEPLLKRFYLVAAWSDGP